MSILVGIPVIRQYKIWQECLTQLLNKGSVHILVVLNGADPDVIEVTETVASTHPNITIIRNPENVFVTAAWNQIMKFFRQTDHERLCILNSDLTLMYSWEKICQAIWNYEPDAVLIPTVTDDKNKCYIEPANDYSEIKLHNEGEFAIPGIFITLNRKQCKLVYPIDERIRVWFNDQYIYSLLSAAKYPIVTLKNLYAFHHHSTSVGSVANIHQIIEEDKIIWRDKVRPELERKIAYLKEKYT